MPHVSVLFLTLFLAGALLPKWLTLTVGYLAARSLSSLFDIPPLLTVGPADLHISDILLLGTVYRFILELILRRFVISRVVFSRLPGMWAFMIVMFVSTLLAYFQFGLKLFTQEIVALLRLMIVPFALLLLLPSYKLDDVSWERGLRAMRWVAYLAAASIYLGLVFGIGEVNPAKSGESIFRYQGVLGDSVKLFLVPFILWEMLRGNAIATGFLTVALLLTGGRMGVVALLVGLSYMLWTNLAHLIRRRHVLYVGAAAVLLLIGFIMDWGGVRTRFFEAPILEQEIGRRVETWKLGLMMGRDFWLTGAGYSAYRLLFEDYYTVSSSGAFPPFDTETYSQFIKAFVDGGVFGVMAFAWMMLNFMHISRRYARRRSPIQAEKELRAFLDATHVTAITFLLLSPFVVWLQAGSKVGYAFMLFMAMATCYQDLRVRSKVRRQKRGD